MNVQEAHEQRILNMECMMTLLRRSSAVLLTNHDAKVGLRSRPMSRVGLVEEGKLRFIVDKASSLVGDLSVDANVNITYMEPLQEVFVSATGSAKVINDPQLVLRHWQDVNANWSDGELEPDDCLLLEVKITAGEYWHGHQGIIGKVTRKLEELIAWTSPKPDEHAQVGA